MRRDKDTDRCQGRRLLVFRCPMAAVYDHECYDHSDTKGK